MVHYRRGRRNGSCFDRPAEVDDEREDAMTETRTAEKTVYLPALGEGDAERLERELGNLEGVVSFDVDAERQRLRIEWTEATIDWPAILWFLEQAGFPPGAQHGGS